MTRYYFRFDSWWNYMEKETVGERLARLAQLPLESDDHDGNLYCFEVPIDTNGLLE